MTHRFEFEEEAFRRLLKEPQGVAYVETTALLLAFPRVRHLLTTSKSEKRRPLYEALYKSLRDEINRRVPPPPIRDDW